jgi:hypothetical protein
MYRSKPGPTRAVGRCWVGLMWLALAAASADRHTRYGLHSAQHACTASGRRSTCIQAFCQCTCDPYRHQSCAGAGHDLAVGNSAKGPGKLGAQSSRKVSAVGAQVTLCLGILERAPHPQPAHIALNSHPVPKSHFEASGCPSRVPGVAHCPCALQPRFVDRLEMNNQTPSAGGESGA